MHQTLRSERSGDALEILVIDNDSHDESLAVLARYPAVRVFALEHNHGFTGACNIGFQEAKGAIQVLLNNDTEVDARWLEAIAAAFEHDPRVGLVASKMLLFDRRDTFHTAGDYVTLDGLAHNRGVWQCDEGQYDHAAYVFSACGGSAAYRRTMLDEIGTLDADFFFSFEDVDLAWRAQLAGWRCLYTPQAIVYHKLKASGGGPIASFHDGRNRLYTLVKNYPSDLWRKYGRRVIGAHMQIAWEALRMVRGAEARATLRGMLAGMAGMPKMLRKRHQIQAARQVERAYLERLMTPPYEIRP
jgi:GT2 family glycosyltransferase